MKLIVHADDIFEIMNIEITKINRFYTVRWQVVPRRRRYSF